ncbi:MAG: hypothetical protein CMH61_02810 [Nanoarchaeota archaeon]|nr:hypothetical protein [Nanoarchaeota archaeon]|tara:strand:- start:1297 stop:2400 length:1104 start_codon:yes stop_codon:yes gene_type:complete
MNILFVCENYLPHFGGAEVVFKNLAERYVELGHSVDLVTHRMQGTKKNEIIGGVTIHRIPSLYSRYLFTFSSILKTVQLAKKSDIIQTTTFNGAVPAWIAGKVTGKKVVLTVHEVWGGKWKKVTGFSHLKSWLHEFLEWCIYKLPFDKYVCVSEATRKDLLKRINEKKVQVIHNGFDYDFWNPDNYDARKLLPNNYVFFSWGRPGASKGFQYVIKAMSIVRKKIPGARLVLMFGSADKYKKKFLELKRLIRDKNLQDVVKILRPVQHGELGHILKSIDCGVVPSVAEGFGYNAIEVTAMGKPVIVSDAGSLPEVVSGEHVIFESTNVPDLAKKMIAVHNGEVVKTPIKKFEWKSTIDNYLKTYKSVM